jgi:hypothetical protein
MNSTTATPYVLSRNVMRVRNFEGGFSQFGANTRAIASSI